MTVIPRTAARIAVAPFLSSMAFAASASAANVNATWNGGAGNWNGAVHWSGNVVPNNGSDTFSVFIDGGNMVGSLVTLDVGVTISNLTIDAGDQLSQNNSQHLSLAGGTLVNNGTWSLNSVADATDLGCNGGATLSGSGSIVMSNNSNNRILADDTVCSGGTLSTSGSGRIRPIGGSTFSDLVNSGTVEQTNSQSAAIAGTVTDNGTWKLSSVGDATDLTCLNGATLAGSGSLVMSNAGNNRLLTNNTQCVLSWSMRGAL